MKDVTKIINLFEVRYFLIIQSLQFFENIVQLPVLPVTMWLRLNFNQIQYRNLIEGKFPIIPEVL